MKDKALGYWSKSRRDEILFEIKSQALARSENQKFIISEMKASSQGSVQSLRYTDGGKFFYNCEVPDNYSIEW